MSESLLLSDGQRDLELMGLSPNGIVTVEWNPPLFAREHTYAESPDSSGRRRIRSKENNAEGSWKGVVSHTSSEASFWDKVDELQEMVEAAHRKKGTIRYAPPPNGEPVTFDLESIEVSGIPQKGTQLYQLLCEPEFKFECQPYGRLDPVQILSGQSLAGPIAGVELVNVPGHTYAWPELTLTDSSGQSRGHVEVAIQEDYDPAAPDPLFLNLASGLTVSGYAGSSTTRAGSYATNVARATLTSSPVVVCATTAQAHKGRWKVRCRVYPSTADIRVRLAWKVGDGPVSRERWVGVPAASNFFDLDLETIQIEELTSGHSWTGFFEAYATAGVPTLDVDTIFLVPA